MPNEATRPISNINSGWGAGNTHLTVDDAVISPTAGSGDFISLNDWYSGVAQQWGCNAPVNVGTISSATIRIYVRFDGNSDGWISSARIRLNNTWYTASVGGSPSGGSWGWMTATASGSFGQMATSSPAIELTFYASTPDSTMDIDVAYLDIDYDSGGPPSSFSKFLMFFN